MKRVLVSPCISLWQCTSKVVQSRILTRLDECLPLAHYTLIPLASFTWYFAHHHLVLPCYHFWSWPLLWFPVAIFNCLTIQFSIFQRHWQNRSCLVWVKDGNCFWHWISSSLTHTLINLLFGYVQQHHQSQSLFSNFQGTWSLARLALISGSQLCRSKMSQTMLLRIGARRPNQRMLSQKCQTSSPRARLLWATFFTSGTCIKARILQLPFFFRFSASLRPGFI